MDALCFDTSFEKYKPQKILKLHLQIISIVPQYLIISFNPRKYLIYALSIQTWAAAWEPGLWSVMVTPLVYKRWLVHKGPCCVWNLIICKSDASKREEKGDVLHIKPGLSMYFTKVQEIFFGISFCRVYTRM